MIYYCFSLYTKYHQSETESTVSRPIYASIRHVWTCFSRNVEGQIGIGVANWNNVGVKMPHLFQDCEDKELRDLIVLDGSCGYYHTNELIV